MSRGRVSIHVFLCCLMLLLFIGCSKKDDAAPIPAYSQADLTGTWHVSILRNSVPDPVPIEAHARVAIPVTDPAWMKATVTADSTGALTFLSCLDSSGGTTCPTDTITWTINGSGVIVETNDAITTDTHCTMTSKKNLIACTGTSGSGSPQLLLAQKEIPGTVYTGDELKNKSIVAHGSYGGHMAFDTDATGAATGIGTFSVSSTGNVMVTWDAGPMPAPVSQGFLSDDKKTFVVLEGTGFWIYQITTGQVNTVSALPAGTSVAYALAVGDSPAPFWLRYTATVGSLGAITTSDPVSSTPVTLGTSYTGSVVDMTGTVNIAEIPTFHGQLSYDGTFMVGTQTFSPGIYMLQVNIK